MSYINDTEYASRNLIDLITKEEDTLSETSSKLDAKQAEFECWHRDFRTSDLHEDFSDAHVMHAFGRAAKAHAQATALEEQVNELKKTVDAREKAIQALCGALLQIARQGISTTHGRLSEAPAGRQIAGVCIRDVIWQGRNQALHFEENEPHQPVKDLFQELENTMGSEYSLSLPISLW